jgi:hypothetical protein
VTVIVALTPGDTVVAGTVVAKTVLVPIVVAWIVTAGTVVGPTIVITRKLASSSMGIAPPTPAAVYTGGIGNVEVDGFEPGLLA